MNLTFDLSEIVNSDRGFTITATGSPDSVSSNGDLNGDGFSDIIIGVPFGDNQTGDGEAYVIFGQENNSNINVNNLNGNNGFSIFRSEEGFANLGESVSIGGDFNGDGFDDAIVGAPFVGPAIPIRGGISSSNFGEAYVVFGREDGFESDLDTNSLNGDNGFRIPGLDARNSLGRSVSNAGDVNGDDIEDILVRAPSISTTYVIFGDTNGFSTEFDLSSINGSNGFTISGLDAGDYDGFENTSAGDLNGDGFADIIVAAADRSGREGIIDRAYVIFGSDNTTQSNININDLNGSNGFTINGTGLSSFYGGSISSAGDLNGDGLDDIVVGDIVADTEELGQAYVIFGTLEGFDAEFDLNGVDGSNGFVIQNSSTVLSQSDEFIGRGLGDKVTSIGDFNGDGLDDIAVSEPTQEKVHILFGSDSGFNSVVDVNNLTPAQGFAIENESISSISGGDIDGDGLSDLTIIGRYANYDSATYVVFGFDPTDEPTSPNVINVNNGNNSLNGTAGDDIINGLGGRDTLFGRGGNDQLSGNAGNDLLNGNAGNDSLFGGLGNDVIFAGTENDQLFGGEGEDVLWGQAGNDTLVGGQGTDVLYGNNGNDVLIGGDGTDILFGNNGNDFLAGNTGKDILFGNSGADTLYGGQGNDNLWGGTGADVFELTRGANVGVDRVKDYVDGVDKFQLSDRFGLGSLAFNDLTITQNGNNAQIRISDNNQLLAVVENTNANQLNGNDFIVG